MQASVTGYNWFMFRRLRTIHKWIGVVAALFLVLISATGFLLAIKDRANAIRPSTQKGQKVTGLAQVVSLDVAANAAFAVGLPELKTLEDIDRFEYNTSKNVFKVLSTKAYHEVQVDGATGKVLSVGTRNDQMFEDIHDLSFFNDFLHDWWLPVVAVGLFCLAFSGLWIFFVPVVRRWKYNRTKA